MRIKYEIKFDEPLNIDGDWPLDLPSGGKFQIKRENGKAVAFTVEFTEKPSDIFSVKDGVNSITDFRWNEMMLFYDRLKSYLQCVSEIDFDPQEVYAHYLGETEEEKKQILMYKMVISKPEERTTIDHEILAAAVFSSYNDDNQAPYFLGELKRMSRRSKRERRYVDSFRYDFLIMETLYGKGKFKTKQLADAMKSEKQFLDILQRAKEQTSLRIATIKDETETLICSSCSSEDLVDHIIKMRGYYFHGNKRMTGRRDRRVDEALTLCNFSNYTTSMVLQELTSHIYEYDSWKQYEECAKREGMITELDLSAQVWNRAGMKSIRSRHTKEEVGDVESSRNRIKWALSAIDQLQYDETRANLESLVGKDRVSGRELFEIWIAREEHLDPQSGATYTDTNGGIGLTLVEKYEFSDEEEERKYQLPMDSNTHRRGPTIQRLSGWLGRP